MAHVSCLYSFTKVCLWAAPPHIHTHLNICHDIHTHTHTFAMAFNRSRFKCERTLKVASKHKCDDNEDNDDDHTRFYTNKIDIGYIHEFILYFDVYLH